MTSDAVYCYISFVGEYIFHSFRLVFQVSKFYIAVDLNLVLHVKCVKFCGNPNKTVDLYKLHINKRTLFCDRIENIPDRHINGNNTI